MIYFPHFILLFLPFHPSGEYDGGYWQRHRRCRRLTLLSVTLCFLLRLLLLFTTHPHPHRGHRHSHRHRYHHLRRRHHSQKKEQAVCWPKLGAKDGWLITVVVVVVVVMMMMMAMVVVEKVLIKRFWRLKLVKAGMVVVGLWWEMREVKGVCVGGSGGYERDSCAADVFLVLRQKSTWKQSRMLSYQRQNCCLSPVSGGEYWKLLHAMNWSCLSYSWGINLLSW